MDKILVYALSENVGGVEEYVLNLSRYNSGKYYEYEYIILGSSSPYENEMRELGVKYYFVTPKRHFLKNIRDYINLFKNGKRRYKAIYFNTSVLVYPIPYILARIFGYPIILHSHSAGTNGLRKIIHLFNRSWVKRMCCLKFACSSLAGHWMFGEKNEDFVIIPNAIDLYRYKFNSNKRKEIRTQLGINDEIVLGHVGRLSSVKNQKYLLRILEQAKKEGYNWKLLLVGDGEDELSLKEEVKLLGLTKDVYFYGRTSHTEWTLSAMDCFVMPSIVEGFPISLVEAQASGLSCVVSDTITEEVNLLGNITFISLQSTYMEWVNAINNISLVRNENINLLEKMGFDVFTIENLVGSKMKDGTES